LGGRRDGVADREANECSVEASPEVARGRQGFRIEQRIWVVVL